MIEKVILRPADRGDVESMLLLIQELAEFEKAGNEVTITAQDLMEDGFGERSAFQGILAERNGTIEGMALLYECYSTWKGRTLYLEDLIVTESARGQGIGEALLRECISMTKKGAYKRLEWQVLDWNERAIEFYQKMGIEMDDTWINCRIRF